VFNTKFTNAVVQPRLKYSMLCAAVLVVFGQSLHAETASSPAPTSSPALHSYHLAAGPLAASLREISRISGTSIRFEAPDVQDAKAPAINGSLDAVAAVQQAIADSGLTMSVLPNGVIQVYIHQLGAITVTASVSEAERGFKASRSDTATRSGAALKEVPQAISVVTAKVIETQQAQSVQELLKNVAGVVVNETAQGVTQYKIRGFSQTGGMVNGTNNSYASSTNVAGIDRVEVIKGPTAILSGADVLGGAVNIVLKKPTAERIRDVQLSYGSHQDLSGSIDIADAITQDQKLSYRLIWSKARADHNYAGYDGRENDYVMGALRWKDDRTDLTVGVSRDKSYSAQNRYTFAFDYIRPTPTNRLGNPHDGVKVDSKTAYYDFEQTLLPWLTLVSRVQYSEIEQDLNVWNTRYPLDTDNVTVMMANSNNVADYKILSGDHYFRVNFDTGNANHKLSTGINHSTTKQSFAEYSTDEVPVEVYGAQVEFPNQRSAANLMQIMDTKSKNYGYFLQDLITWGDFHVLLGARRNNKTTDPSETYYPSFGQTVYGKKSVSKGNSYNAGVVYDLTANTSLYASYAEGFYPQSPTGTFCGAGSNFPDMETSNKELGLKGESPSGGLSWQLAAYQLDQSNVLEMDTARNCYVAHDSLQIKGVELETSGRILPGWNVIFNYAYNNTKDTSDSDNLPGMQPKHQASVWSTYDFQAEQLRGLGLALGITAYSASRLGYLADDPMAPGGARVDAGISYQHGDDWSVRLNLKNLFDRTLYGYAGTTLYVPVYDGRTATLTWKFSF
jgi:iron complex outermembrane receptor protein